MFSLDGKTCAITGAATGIGFEMARLFSKSGAKCVFLLDIDEKSAKEAASKITGRAIALRCDVTSASSVRECFNKMMKMSDRIDILCNNAGIGHVGSIKDATETDLDRVVKVNINGVFNCAKEAIRVMTSDGKGGVILNTGSCASVHPIKDRVVYAATKGAVLTMTTSLATDHVHEGIRCNCICPGRVHTPFVDAFIKKNYAGNEKKMFKQLSEYMPQGRMLTPGEVAALALYLCSDEARMITGAAITIDGGIQGVDHPKVYDKAVEMHPAFRSVL